MKKIFKFFPVALAAIAMASCSSDDLTEGNYISQEDLDPTKLYVVLEDEGDVTRGGFSEGIVDGSLKRKLFFQEGDQMKVYHDQTNWRPQVWKYEGEANIAYEKNKGLVASTFKAEGEQYTSGYGVFPATLAKFTEEDRSKAEFDLTSLANVEWSAAASTVYEDGTDTYVAPMPLWGYSPDNVMKAHYLTGYLRIEASQLEAVEEGKAIYMVIQSAAGEPLNGKFDVEIDPEKLLEQEPALVCGTAGTATNMATGVDAVENAAKDVIVLKIGKRAAGPFVAYVPIVAGVSGLKVYKTAPIDEATAPGTMLKTGVSANLGDGTPYAIIDGAYIKERNKSDEVTTQRGVFYNIIKDDTKVVASSPFALAEIIKTMDAKMVRDFSITVDPATPTVVDRRNTDTPNKFVLDLGDYTLKNNVTVNVAFTSYQNSNADILEVKTKAGSKTLKLNLVTAASQPLKEITFNDDNIKGPVELAGANLNIDGFVVNAGTKNLTIKSSAKKVKATAETNIDAYDGGVGQFNEIRVQEGCEKVNLVNGIINYIYFETSLTKDVTIDGIGRAAIKNIGGGLLTAAGKQNVLNNGQDGTAAKPYNYVHFITSEWDGSAFASEGNAQLLNNGGKIYFAGQLYAAEGGYSAGYTIMAESMDLNHKAWKPVDINDLTITANYTGATLAKDQKQTKIENVKISTSADNAGLFAEAGSISNIDLENVTIETTADGKKNIGALVGAINGNISNVKVKTVTINATGLSENIGALAGLVTGTARVFTDIEIDGANLTGYTKMGGIIGYVDGNLTIGVSKDKVGLSFTSNVPASTDFTKGEAVMTTTNDAENVCSVKNVTFTQNTKPGTYQYIPAYAAVGDYVGSVNVAKTLYIFTEKAAATKPLFNRHVNYTDFGKFTFSDSDGSTYVVAIGREQHLVGLSGFNVKVDPTAYSESTSPKAPTVIFFNRTAEKKFAAHNFVTKVGTTADKVDLTADNYLNYTGVVK